MAGHRIAFYREGSEGGEPLSESVWRGCLARAERGGGLGRGQKKPIVGRIDDLPKVSETTHRRRPLHGISKEYRALTISYAVDI